MAKNYKCDKNSFENLYKDAKKDKNGYVKIMVRFYSNDKRLEDLDLFGDVYACVLAKPVKLTKEDLARGTDEAKRVNLTRWKFKDIPSVKKKIGKVAGTYLCYWNGSECAWKSDDEGIECDTSGITEDKLEAELNALAEEKGTYAPHCDSEGNYGDESVHAVYDELNKLKYDWRG